MQKSMPLNPILKSSLKIQLIISLIFTFLLFSCDSGDKSDRDEKDKTSGDPKIELGTFESNLDLEECHCDSLYKDSLKTYFRNDEPYTGRCFDNYPNTQNRYMEMSFLDGKIHGFFTVYDKTGEILSKDRYHKGEILNRKKEGDKNIIYCRCDSLKEEKLTFGNKTIKKYKDIPFTGVCYDYYPESEKKYMEINYQEGFAHGKMMIFDKSGEIITIENYEMGEKIN